MRHLYLDSLDHPEKYQEDVRSLFERLAHGASPTSEELSKLDTAVLDFSARPPSKPVEKRVERPVEPKQQEETEYGPQLGDMPPYWWL